MIFEYTFASVSEANIILGESTPWEDAEDEAKQTALEYGVIYMRKNFNIPTSEDNTTTNQALKNANAILGNYHLTKPLFQTEVEAKPQRGLKRKKVKGDVAEVETEYDTSYSSQYVDPFPEVSAMLNVAGFSSKKGSGMQTVPLVRR